jgi:L-aminopeptidase/D-esterase-like protein
MKTIGITDIDGLLVGHAVNSEYKTGCTVVLMPDGAPASAHVPGFAPGTRELELLNPLNIVTHTNAILLTGGSAFGLSAATGVVNFLREQNKGFTASSLKVPIVSAAVIYDYPLNTSKGLYPNEAMGYQAARNANSDPVRSGPYGVGYSAVSGKLASTHIPSASGIGSYGMHLESGLQVAALVVVNPLGSIVDPHTGEIISGLRKTDNRLLTRQDILNSLALLPGDLPMKESQHTVLGVVATNAKLDKLQANRLARMASSGIARTIYPSHLLYDGDIVFAIGSDKGPVCDISYLGAVASEVVATAIVNSVPGR